MCLGRPSATFRTRAVAKHRAQCLFSVVIGSILFGFQTSSIPAVFWLKAIYPLVCGNAKINPWVTKQQETKGLSNKNLFMQDQTSRHGKISSCIYQWLSNPTLKLQQRTYKDECLSRYQKVDLSLKRVILQPGQQRQMFIRGKAVWFSSKVLVLSVSTVNLTHNSFNFKHFLNLKKSDSLRQSLTFLIFFMLESMWEALIYFEVASYMDF